MAEVHELLDQQKDLNRTVLEQQEKKTCVQTIIDCSNRTIDDLSKQVYDLKLSLEMTPKEFDDFKMSCKTWSKNCSETDLDILCKSFILILDKTDYLEGQSGCSNVAVDGIKESGKEKVSESEEQPRELFSEKL